MLWPQLNFHVLEGHREECLGYYSGGGGQRGASLVGTAQYPRKIGEGPINVAPSEGKKTMENTPLNCG